MERAPLDDHDAHRAAYDEHDSDFYEHDDADRTTHPGADCHLVHCTSQHAATRQRAVAAECTARLGARAQPRAGELALARQFAQSRVVGPRRRTVRARRSSLSPPR